MTPLEVLKDKEQGITLYSPCYGDVKFLKVNDDDYPIEFEDEKGHRHGFTAEGKVANGFTNAEVTLFPSVNLKEWDKFIFKKGDILEHENGMECVEFIEYETSEENPANNYTMFKGKCILPEESKGNIDYFTTWCFKPVKKPMIKFKPFDKILYKDDINKYHIGIVEKQDSGRYVHLIGCLTSYYIADVYPYKEEMERYIGETATDETENEIKKILENG